MNESEYSVCASILFFILIDFLYHRFIFPLFVEVRDEVSAIVDLLQMASLVVIVIDESSAFSEVVLDLHVEPSLIESHCHGVQWSTGVYMD